MSKMFQVYGIGQALIPVLPPPLGFEAAPTSNQTNYEIGQMVYTPQKAPTAFYMYAGGGNWVEISTSSGDVLSVTGTANQILASPTTGSVVLSLIGPYTPATYTAHGVLVGEGTSSIVATAAGTTGQVLTATTSMDPAFAAIGTGSGLTSNGILLGGGASGFSATAALTSGQTLVGVTGGAPVAQTISNSKVTNVPLFTAIPVMSANTGGVAVVTQGHINLWAFPQWGAYFEEYNNVALQVIAPALSATAGRGLNLDVATGANSAIIEITEGNNPNCKNAFTTGTSPAFYVKAGFNIATLANCLSLTVGFRAVQTYQATSLVTYTDYATIGVLNSGTAGEWQIQTQKASGGQTTTDTTQAATAATTFTLEVLVSSAGVVTYLINGSAPTVTAAFTFTASTNVIPFIQYYAASGGHSETDLVSYTCGLQ
jgi:hypothetical protein